MTSCCVVAALLTTGGSPRPSEIQMKYLETEMMGIVHYGLNTYVDREWGFGDTPTSVFKPTALNPEQWVVAAKAGGPVCGEPS